MTCPGESPPAPRGVKTKALGRWPWMGGQLACGTSHCRLTEARASSRVPGSAFEQGAGGVVTRAERKGTPVGGGAEACL